MCLHIEAEERSRMRIRAETSQSIGCHKVTERATRALRLSARLSANQGDQNTDVDRTICSKCAE